MPTPVQPRELLASITGLPVKQRDTPRGLADVVLQIGPCRFLVELKNQAQASTVSSAVDQLKAAAAASPEAELLLIVPAMSATGAAICESRGVNWADFAGNADINCPGLRVRIRGNRSRLAAPSSGFNPFSRRASRLVHALLNEPHKAWSRQELSLVTGLEKGFVSRAVAALIDEGYVEDLPASGKQRIVRVEKPLTLFDGWRERYVRPDPFAYGLLASKDGADTVRMVERLLSDAGIEHAFTGLPAAAAYTNFGSFRRVSVYVHSSLAAETIDRLHVEPDPRGRNVVITYSPDEPPIGERTIRRIRYVSPFLAALDVAGEPERSQEAADELLAFIRELLTK